MASASDLMQLLQPAVEEHGAQFVADQADHNERVSWALAACETSLCASLKRTRAGVQCRQSHKDGLCTAVHPSLLTKLPNAS